MITALVFAAYHMNLLQFIYVTVMGLIMSYMIYNSKSIFVTAFFHLINNSFSVFLEYNKDFVQKVPFFAQDRFELKDVFIYLTIGIVLLLMGFLISDNKMGLFAKRKKQQK